MIDKLISHLSASFDAESAILHDVLSPMAGELLVAQDGVLAALDQMAMTTADGEWLDEWGGYFGVPRMSGEPDSGYGQRIIGEVLRPKENNVAIAKAIKEAFGQDAVVVDVTAWDNAFNTFSGVNSYNGIITYSDAATVRYGLFDIQSDYNLEAGDSVAQFSSVLRSFVDRFRAAGTQLRLLSLGGSKLDDLVTASTDAARLTVTRLAHFNGNHAYGGGLDYSGPHSESEMLS